MAAKPKADFFRPARWHSITAEVRMGTTSAHTHKRSQWPFWWVLGCFILSLLGSLRDSRVGNLLMLLLTRISMRAALRWSPLFTWICTTTLFFTGKHDLLQCKQRGKSVWTTTKEVGVVRVILPILCDSFLSFYNKDEDASTFTVCVWRLVLEQTRLDHVSKL